MLTASDFELHRNQLLAKEPDVLLLMAKSGDAVWLSNHSSDILTEVNALLICMQQNEHLVSVICSAAKGYLDRSRQRNKIILPGPTPFIS